jgi:putative addiction module component (TIGR02574 family)
MIATADMLLESALLLPIHERSHMASRLIESVDDDDDFELSPAWEEEIARRIEAVRSGKSRRIPHADTMAEMQKLIANF